MEISKISLSRSISKAPTPPRITKFYENSCIVGDELQFQEEVRCSICSEFLIKATTLNCSHTFCKYCIDRWMTKQSDCPICRSKIVYQVPTLVLDNIIENIIKSKPRSIRKHRERLIAERHNKHVTPKASKRKLGWIKMRRMNGLKSYYMIPKNSKNARRHPNEVTIMYFEDNSEWEDIGEDS